jgi:hypothetical protein
MDLKSDDYHTKIDPSGIDMSGNGNNIILDVTGGKVGIGTNDPQSALDVSGAITISENGKLAFDDTQVQKTWFGPDGRGGEDISGGGWTMLKNLPPNSSHGFNEHSSDGTFTQDEGTESLSNVFGRPVLPFVDFAPDELLFTTLLNNGDRIWWILDYNKLTNISTGNGWATAAPGNLPGGYRTRDDAVKEQSTNSGSANWLMVSGNVGTFFDKSLYINNGSINPVNSNGEQYTTSGNGEQYVLYFSGIAPGGPNTLGYNGEFLLNQGMSIFVRDSTNIATNPVPYPTLIKKEADHLHISAPLSIYPVGDYELAGFKHNFDLKGDQNAVPTATAPGTSFDGQGGWQLVRHLMPDALTMIDVDDNLKLSATLGTFDDTAGGTSATFTRPVSHYDYDEILIIDFPPSGGRTFPFISSDSNKNIIWQIWDRVNIDEMPPRLPEQQWKVKRTSRQNSSHTVRVWTNTSYTEQPWISYTENYEGNDNYFLYGEGGYAQHQQQHRGSTSTMGDNTTQIYVRRSDGQPVRLKNKVQVDVDGNLDMDGTITCSRITGSNWGRGTYGRSIMLVGLTKCSGHLMTNNGGGGMRFGGWGVSDAYAQMSPDNGFYTAQPSGSPNSGQGTNKSKFAFLAHTPGTSSETTVWLNHSAWQAIYFHSDNAASGSIYCQKGTMYGNFSASDARIKTEIEDVDDKEALDQINRLELKKYHYIDPLLKNEYKTIGFIAQQAISVVPNIKLRNTHDYVPDEQRYIEDFELIEQEDGNWKLFYDFDWRPEDTKKVKFLCSAGTGDTQCEQVRQQEDGSFIFRDNYDKIFIYGRRVNNFNHIDKTQLNALCCSGIQELDRKHKALEAKQDAKIVSLETDYAQLKADITPKTADLSELKNEISLIKQHLGI